MGDHCGLGGRDADVLAGVVDATLKERYWCWENPTPLTGATLSRLHDLGWVVVSAFYDVRALDQYSYIFRREAAAGHREG